MNEQQERKLAENEALAREVNERVGDIAASWYAEAERLEFVCECSHSDCAERIHLTMDEYARVRASTQTFVLVRDHVVEEIEDVVGEAGDAVVVEKIGPGREVAAETAD